MITYSQKTLTILVGAIIGTFIAAFAFFQPANAFSQTRIIDDELFTDATSMSVAEIQSWLENNGGDLLENWIDDVDMFGPDGCMVHKATNMTAAEIIYEAAATWGGEKIFDCEGNDVQYWDDISGYTLETISPKAILVMLEKEQTLINASGDYSRESEDYDDTVCCANNEYKLAWATGFGVPDSGGKNNRYKGFYRQVNWAAWQLRFNYERSQGNTAWDEVDHLYYPGPMLEGTAKRCGTCNEEQFDGFYTIDGSPIYMSNASTAALYYYTPHTYPGYFGNFNFVLYYERWFGPVNSSLYVASITSQADQPRILQGVKKSMWVRIKNDGQRSWYDNVSIASAPDGSKAIELVTANPPFHDSDWSFGWEDAHTAKSQFFRVYESDGTTLTANQNVVNPGEIAQIDYVLGTKNRNVKTGIYSESLQLRTTDGLDVSPVITVSLEHIQKSFEADLVSFSANETVVAGERELTSVRYQNTGTSNWYDAEATTIPNGESPIRLITTRSILRNSRFGHQWGPDKNVPQTKFSKVYTSDGTTLAPNQHVARPGDIIKMDFFLDTPDGLSAYKTYNEWFRLQKTDGTIVMPDFKITIDLIKPEYSAELIKKDSPDTVTRGNRTLSWVRYKNTGNTIWYDDAAVNGSDSVSAFASGKDPVQLISTKPLLRYSKWGKEWGPDNNVPNDTFGKVFKANGSLSSNPHRVLPGETAQINFFLSTDDASLSNGTYTEWIRLARQSGPYLQPATTAVVTLR